MVPCWQRSRALSALEPSGDRATTLLGPGTGFRA